MIADIEVAFIIVGSYGITFFIEKVRINICPYVLQFWLCVEFWRIIYFFFQLHQYYLHCSEIGSYSKSKLSNGIHYSFHIENWLFSLYVYKSKNTTLYKLCFANRQSVNVGREYKIYMNRRPLVETERWIVSFCLKFLTIYKNIHFLDIILWTDEFCFTCRHCEFSQLICSGIWTWKS